MIKNIEEVKALVNVPEALTPQEQATVEIFKDRANKLLRLCEETIVEDYTQVKVAEELMKDAQTLEKAIEKRRKGWKAPLITLGKLVDALFGEPKETAEEAKRVIKEKILAFNDRVEEERVRLEDGVELIKGSLVEEDIKIKGLRTTVDFEIVDESLIPREYLMVDIMKIRRDAKLGVEIPGVKLFKKTSVQ